MSDTPPQTLLSLMDLHAFSMYRPRATEDLMSWVGTCNKGLKVFYESHNHLYHKQWFLVSEWQRMDTAPFLNKAFEKYFDVRVVIPYIKIQTRYLKWCNFYTLPLRCFRNHFLWSGCLCLSENSIKPFATTRDIKSYVARSLTIVCPSMTNVVSVLHIWLIFVSN